jgi:hypothetical protein
VRITGSEHITFTGCCIHDETDTGQPGLFALLELAHCQRISITGSQFIDGVIGVAATDCAHVTLTGNTLHDTRSVPVAKHAVQFTGTSMGHLVANNTISKTSGDPIAGDAQANGNVIAAQ